MPAVSYLLNVLYALLLFAASPVILFRMLFRGKYRRGWSQKLLGRLPPRQSDGPCFWIHAVSVGEVLQLETLLEQLAARFPGHSFVISTTTDTGFDVARRKFPAHEICYFPLDFTWSVRRAMSRMRPAAILLVELELWPNFIRIATKQNIPVLLINGRISEHSFQGYRRVKLFVRPMVRALSVLAVQNETYADRFIALGAPTQAVRITGSVKFDRVETDSQNPATRRLKQEFGIHDDDRVFIAGSTQFPEEDFALDAYAALRDEFPELRLILVPRHKERFEEVAQFVSRRGLPLLRRSQPASNAVPPTRPVILLDTLGELSACWGLAEIAFVGGSLSQRGGQNMIEPSAYGAAVCFGPHTQNFSEVVEALLSRKAARVVADRGELARVVREFLLDPDAARSAGLRARELVLEQQGATARTVSILQEVLRSEEKMRCRANRDAA